MAELDGKVVVVTGSSRGIGKAIAQECAAQGAKVVVVARTEEAGGRLPGTIHQTVQEIQDAGGQAMAVRCDVTDEEAVQALDPARHQVLVALLPSCGNGVPNEAQFLEALDTLSR